MFITLCFYHYWWVCSPFQNFPDKGFISHGLTLGFYFLLWRLFLFVSKEIHNPFFTTWVNVTFSHYFCQLNTNLFLNFLKKVELKRWIIKAGLPFFKCNSCKIFCQAKFLSPTENLFEPCPSYLFFDCPLSNICILWQKSTVSKSMQWAGVMLLLRLS